MQWLKIVALSFSMGCGSAATALNLAPRPWQTEDKIIAILAGIGVMGGGAGLGKMRDPEMLRPWTGPDRRTGFTGDIPLPKR